MTKKNNSKSCRKYVLKPTAKTKQTINLIYNGLCSKRTIFCSSFR